MQIISELWLSLELSLSIKIIFLILRICLISRFCVTKTNSQIIFIQNAAPLLISANNSIRVSGGDDVDDFKSTGSVLEKLSLFEKLEQRQASTAAALAKSNSIILTTSIETPQAVRRNDDLSKSVRSTDKDPGIIRTSQNHFPESFLSQITPI